MLEFLGCYFGVIMAYLTIEAVKSLKKAPAEVKREAPKNISSISDPLTPYSRYTDDKSKLYKSIKPIERSVNRIEIGRDEDTL